LVTKTWLLWCLCPTPTESRLVFGYVPNGIVVTAHHDRYVMIVSVVSNHLEYDEMEG
jgi:hypothetical protein